MNTLIDNIRKGAYATLKDGSAVLVFSYANVSPQWQSVDAYITEKLGIPDVGADRVAMEDNAVIGLRGEDIWDEVYESEG